MCGPYGQFLRYVGESTCNPHSPKSCRVETVEDAMGARGCRAWALSYMSGNFDRRWEALGISENEDLAC